MSNEAGIRNTALRAILIGALAVLVLGPRTRAATCGPIDGPAASLLFPYFEVDLGDPEGRSTNISINNAGDAPHVAHVVLWTNRGVPSLTFNLILNARQVQSISLRRLFADGRLPTSGEDVPGTTFPLCGGIIDPSLDAPARAALVARHTGRPDPESGLCFGDPVDEALVTGFITVDVLRDCAAPGHTPGEEGYFTGLYDGGASLATLDNVLWGDLFLLDPRGDFAQGLDAIGLQADSEAFNGQTATFYRRLASSGDDHRMPLDGISRVRYLEGGAFDGGTDLLVWHDAFGGEAFPCQQPSDRRFEVSAGVRNEGGQKLVEARVNMDLRNVARLRIPSDLAVPTPFGQLDLQVVLAPGPANPLPLAPSQAWFVPLFSAAGRFSVAGASLPIDGPCSPPAAP